MKILKILREKILDFFVQIKSIYAVLMMCPPLFLVLGVLLFIGIVGSAKGLNPIVVLVEVISWAVIAAFIVVMLICIEKPLRKIVKTVCSSLIWLGSAALFVDYSDINFELIFKLATSFELIFLACLLPDFIGDIKELSEKNEKNTTDNEVRKEPQS